MASSSSSSLFLFCILLLLTSPSEPNTITIPLTPTIQHLSSLHGSAAQLTLSHLASLSLSRAHQLKSPNNLSSLLKTPLYARSYGGFSISLSFGSPPQITNFLMDTGSSLVWFPCTSRYLCSDCNVNPSNIPHFIPRLSSSSKLIACLNPKCAMLFGSSVTSRCRGCDTGARNCTRSCPPYVVRYGLGSTAGILLSETLVFPDGLFPDFLVGCSIFSTHQPEGIAGFGRSPESLPSQLGLRKFSYCFVSHRFDETPISSDLILDTGSGSGDVRSGGLRYTRFQKNPNSTNFAFQDYYYLPLRNIIVGGKNVKVPYSYLSPGESGDGGTIVDSGTTLTFMERPIFELVANEFVTQMANFMVDKESENQTGLRPCFNISGVDESAAVPDLVFRFKGGAKMALPLENYFAIVDTDVVCLTILSDNVAGDPDIRGGPAIILGNFQQQNFYIEYDLKHNRFGFKQRSCV